MRSRKGYVKELGSCPYTFLHVFATRYFFWKYHLIHSENCTKNITHVKHKKITNMVFFYTFVYTILPTGSANKYILCIAFVLN